MRTFSPYIRNLISTKANFAFGYDIELSNGQKLHLTNFSSAITINQVTYHPNSSLQITKANFNDSAHDFVEVTGISDKASKLLLEYIQNAKISLSIILIDKATIEPFLTLYCFSVHRQNLHFTLYLKNNITKLAQNATKFYTKTCRASLGDARCGVNIENFAVVTNVSYISNNVILVNTRQPVGYYDYGKVNFIGTSIYMLILKHNASSLILESNVAYELQQISQIKIFPGCDKTYEICYNRFQNVLNFRGEPFVVQFNYEKIFK
jgi:uncharacterized phage protein (TIGR02218 family)